MKTVSQITNPVLLIGQGQMLAGIAVCLTNAGHTVSVCAEDAAAFHEQFNQHLRSRETHTGQKYNTGDLSVETRLNGAADYKLVIAITPEDLGAKQAMLKQLERVAKNDAIVAINTESIELEKLQAGYSRPECLIGLNWCEPAHTTFFLEIITTEVSKPAAEAVNQLAKKHWEKDPYIVNNSGIRSRLLAAMAREAAFLVDNEYASVEDIDRACRNDAGYYLPFCGNLRYMDLMGTYAYGMVMKDLNPDLSKSADLPVVMKQALANGGKGMENKHGFYDYSEADAQKWRDTMAIFSYQIQDIIEKYPFNYNKKPFTD